MDELKVGSYLQALRKAKGLTQQEVADIFDVSNKTISKWECGQTLPEIPLLKAIAEFYDVSVDDILNGGKKFDEEKNEIRKKVNEKYYYKKQIKKYNLFILLSYITGGLAYLMLFLLTYSTFKQLLASLVSLVISFGAFALYFIGKYLYGDFSEYSDELKEQINKEKYKKLCKLFIYNGTILAIILTTAILGAFYYQMNGGTCYIVGWLMFLINLVIILLGLIAYLFLVVRLHEKIEKKMGPNFKKIVTFSYKNNIGLAVITLASIVCLIFLRYLIFTVYQYDYVSEGVRGPVSSYSGRVTIFNSCIDYSNANCYFLYVGVGLAIVTIVLELVFRKKQNLKPLFICLATISNYLVLLGVDLMIEMVESYLKMNIDRDNEVINFKTVNGVYSIYNFVPWIILVVTLLALTIWLIVFVENKHKNKKIINQEFAKGMD